MGTFSTPNVWKRSALSGGRVRGGGYARCDQAMVHFCWSERAQAVWRSLLLLAAVDVAHVRLDQSGQQAGF